MLTFALDIKGVNVSGGSACNSGSSQGSHVIRALGSWTADYQPVRVSMSKFNTKACADGFLNAVREIYTAQAEAELPNDGNGSQTNFVAPSKSIGIHIRFDFGSIECPVPKLY
jgi:hypothetical protein